jgi:hypothetical protein
LWIGQDACTRWQVDATHLMGHLTEVGQLSRLSPSSPSINRRVTAATSLITATAQTLSSVILRTIASRRDSKKSQHRSTKKKAVQLTTLSPTPQQN